MQESPRGWHLSSRLKCKTLSLHVSLLFNGFAACQFLKQGFIFQTVSLIENRINISLRLLWSCFKPCLLFFVCVAILNYISFVSLQHPRIVVSLMSIMRLLFACLLLFGHCASSVTWGKKLQHRRHVVLHLCHSEVQRSSLMEPHKSQD